MIRRYRLIWVMMSIDRWHSCSSWVRVFVVVPIVDGVRRECATFDRQHPPRDPTIKSMNNVSSRTNKPVSPTSTPIDYIVNSIHSIIVIDALYSSVVERCVSSHRYIMRLWIDVDLPPYTTIRTMSSPSLSIKQLGWIHRSPITWSRWRCFSLL